MAHQPALAGISLPFFRLIRRKPTALDVFDGRASGSLWLTNQLLLVSRIPSFALSGENRLRSMCLMVELLARYWSPTSSCWYLASLLSLYQAKTGYARCV